MVLVGCLVGICVAELVAELFLHLVTHQLILRRVDERVHLGTLGDKWLCLYLSEWQVLWHACLAVWHINLKFSVSSMCVQHNFGFLWVWLLDYMLLHSIFIESG